MPPLPLTAQCSNGMALLSRGRQRVWQRRNLGPICREVRAHWRAFKSSSIWFPGQSHRGICVIEPRGAIVGRFPKRRKKLQNGASDMSEADFWCKLKTLACLGMEGSPSIRARSGNFLAVAQGQPWMRLFPGACDSSSVIPVSRKLALLARVL